MDNKTHQILCALQDGFKLEARPFKRLAMQIGCTEEEVLECVKKCCSEGIIRRIGAAVRPEKTGYIANALVAWQINADQVDEFGTALAEMREISHCYERGCPEGWPYNMYTMVHAKSEQALVDMVTEIASRFSVDQYRILRTEKELKKTSMRYFEESVK